MKGRAFKKMHGLGNDFVVIDARREPFPLDPGSARAIADRRQGVGCDQLIVIEPPTPAGLVEGADVFMRIHNADGGEVEACGNGTRCVAALILGETDSDHVAIETRAGLLHARPADAGRIAVDMGKARDGWQEIPLAEERDTLHIGLRLGPLEDPVGVNMGNPHAVFFVPDVSAVDLDHLGPQLEHHPLFPERANIGVAKLQGPDTLRLRVWERGVGVTRACGTGACAAAVAAARRGLTGREVTVELDGGALQVEWREDGHVIMTGPVATAFSGTLAA